MQPGKPLVSISMIGASLLLATLWTTTACRGPGDDDSHAGSGGDHSHDDHGSAQDQGHDESHGHVHGGDGDSFAVTAWGERFELFPEIDALVAGETAISHTHVTRLADFSPLTRGTVTAVLRAPGGGETVARGTEPVRPGIYNLEIEPPDPGVYELTFRIDDGEAQDEIAAGTVRVGTAEEPGGLDEAPAGSATRASPGEPVSFLKEDQWQTPFATAWVERDSIRASVEGPGRLRPAAGGEIVLTAPVDGVIRSSNGAWPYLGGSVRRDAAVFQITQLAEPEESLAHLEGELQELDAELDVARRQLERMEQLELEEIVARRQVELVEAEVGALEARREAARRDLETARTARGASGDASASAGDRMTIRAPWNGRVASVAVTPGESVEAGDELARLVRTRPLWLEVALSPTEAARLVGDPAGVLVTRSGDSEALPLERVRQVSQAPEVDPHTGTVGVVLEVPDPPATLHIGTALAVEILLPELREGVVIPTSALVDDGGVPVVFVQLDGESFLRREVTVLHRQGDRLLVEALTPGERLVTRGGDTVRRSTLMTSGGSHDHIH